MLGFPRLVLAALLRVGIRCGDERKRQQSRFRDGPGHGAIIVGWWARWIQNFSTQGRNSISQAHALRSCCSRCR